MGVIVISLALILLFETSIADPWEIAIKFSAYGLLAAAVLVFLARAAGAGLVAADFLTSGDDGFLRLSLGRSLSLLDSDGEDAMDDVMLYAGYQTFKKGMAFFLVDDYGLNLPHGIETGLLAEMVHFS